MKNSSKILSNDDLDHIRTHKYSTTGYSWLDNKMNPFWIKCADMLPYWLSPNMVTVIGLIAQLLGITVGFFYDTTFTKVLPVWTNFFMVLVLFLAQTLDAIDGKHARNTKRTSPLGQLMDHGCDAFANSFVVIMIVQAHTFGPTHRGVLVQFLVQLSFFIFTLEEKHTGTLRTQIDNLGVTEFQFIGMGIVMLPAVFGERMSHIVLFNLFTVGDVLIHLNGLFTIKTTLQIIRENCKSIGEFFTKFSPLLSFAILTFAEFSALALQTYQRYPFYYLVINGMFFGFLTSKLIISNMAKHKLQLLDFDCIVYLVCITAAYFSGSYNFELGVLVFCALFISYRYVTYMMKIIRELLNYLQISF